MADEIPQIEVGPDEVPLMVLLVTTRGVHFEPMPVLGTVDFSDQLAVARDIADALRDAAQRLEAHAGLAEDIEEAMKP